jgi:drug/metabolite transporter (DMT)-like permease
MHVTFLLTATAMLAFAANSLLARLALVDGSADAAGFTGLRLASGAALLVLILLLRRGSVRTGRLPGSWASAAALFCYAAAFSYAYLTLGAAMGALVLFGAVQFTMILWGIARGERPGLAAFAGMALAFGGFVFLVAPGLESPDPKGTVLMGAAGIAWGIYSLRGRGSTDPIGDTAGNFIRTVPAALLLLLLSLPSNGMSATGVALSLASGVVASGLGYVVWYTALPALAATRAAIVQLTVPVIAALGGVLFVGEAISAHLVIAATVILGGVAITILSRDRARS